MTEKRNGELPGDRLPDGRFAPGNSMAAKPGEVRNPTGRPKGTYSAKVRALDLTPVRSVKWARDLYCKMFGVAKTDIPRDATIGDLSIHADRVNRIKGRVGYLIEENARKEGKVADKLQVDMAKPIAIALFPSEPPPGWYGKVRDLIGVEPGDPPLPFDANTTKEADNGKDTSAYG